MSGLSESNEKMEFEKQLLLAQQGDAEAQYLVSSYYYDGIGTKQNLSEADKWLKESAKNGYGPAYYMQAQFLAENDENGSKAETVFSLYQKALDNGCTGACIPLGHMRLNGFGCEKSVEEAMKIFRVGMVKELKIDGDMNSLLDSLADVSEEMHTICKKAQTGDGDAFYQIGVLLWHKQEYDLSYKFMVASAGFGDMNGVHELGRAYYYGYGVDANIEVAENLWTFAANHGNAAALRELGDLCTDRGEYAQAYHNYLNSAKGGDDKGRIGVAECYLEGTGCEKNVPEAIKWLNKILEKNNAQPGFNWNTQWVQCAMMYLGGIYLGQDGEEFKNMNKAIATLKEGLKLKDRFTTDIAQALADIYGNKNGDYYNPQEAKKYQKIAEESRGQGNVRFTPSTPSKDAQKFTRNTPSKDAQKARKTVIDSLKEYKGCFILIVICLAVFAGVGMIWGVKGLVKMFWFLAAICVYAALEPDHERGLKFILFCLAGIFALIAYFIA